MAELENFDLESRLRKYISDLVEPTVRRCSETQQLCNQVEYNVGNFQRRFTEVEFQVNKQEKKFGILDEIYRRLTFNENEIKSSDQKIENSNNRTLTFVESVKNDLQLTKEKIDSMVKQQDQIRSENDEQWQKFQQFRESFHQQYRDDSGQLNRTIEHHHAQISELQAKCQALTKGQAIQMANESKLEIELNRNQRSLKELEKDCAELKETSAHKDGLNRLSSYTEKQIKFLKNEQSNAKLEVNKKIQKMTEDMQFDNEIGLQNILYDCLEPKSSKKVAERSLVKWQQFLKKFPAKASQIESAQSKAKDQIKNANAAISNQSPTRTPTTVIEQVKQPRRKITTKTVTRNFASKLGGIISPTAIPEENKDSSNQSPKEETQSSVTNKLTGIFGKPAPAAVPDDSAPSAPDDNVTPDNTSRKSVSDNTSPAASPQDTERSVIPDDTVPTEGVSEVIEPTEVPEDLNE